MDPLIFSGRRGVFQSGAGVPRLSLQLSNFVRSSVEKLLITGLPLAYPMSQSSNTGVDAANTMKSQQLWDSSSGRESARTGSTCVPLNSQTCLCFWSSFTVGRLDAFGKIWRDAMQKAMNHCSPANQISTGPWWMATNNRPSKFSIFFQAFSLCDAPFLKYRNLYMWPALPVEVTVCNGVLIHIG